MPAERNGEKVTAKLTTVDSVVNWKLPLLVVLFVTVIFVAIKTIVHRHESRNMFMQLQMLEKERDKLAAQWSRLKLEQGTMLNQVRVEQNARWDLGMKIPNASEVKVVRESKKATVVAIVESSDVPVESGVSKVALSD